MNWEGLEPDAYYPKQEKKHYQEFKCYCFAVLIFLAGLAAVAFIVGAHSLGRWLMGGG